MLELSMMSVLCKTNSPCNRSWRPVGLWVVDDPTFSRQPAQMTAMSVLRAGRIMDDIERLRFLLCWNTEEHNILVTRLGSGA
jgi:hypothetical protein